MCKETNFFSSLFWSWKPLPTPFLLNMCDHFWLWDKGLHLSAGEKKLDNTTIVKIPERLLRMMLVGWKVNISIKGGVVYMLKDIRRRIFDSQTTLTFNLFAFVDNLPDENGKRPEIIFQLKKKKSSYSLPTRCPTVLKTCNHLGLHMNW